MIRNSTLAMILRGFFIHNYMAKDKKGFILYADLIKVVEKLPDEIAGKLFKIILRYVNDLEVCIDDLLLEIAFEPIKNQLKRDLMKFEEVKLKRSDAGKRSAELRALNKIKQVSTNPTSVESVQQTSTNPTDTVNDTVNDTVIDNVNVNDILLEKETKELFSNWLSYRKEIKKPIKSEKSKIALAKKIKVNGFIISNKVINSSIENSYQGLFWDKFTVNKKEPSNFEKNR